MSFKDLELNAALQKAIEELGFTTPTPVQERAIPEILRGVDVRISAQTGTGKTGAFLLPALHKLAGQPNAKGSGPRVLILVPTRELALQVAAEAAKFSKHLPRMKTVCIFGGSPYPPQYRDLSRPHEILVATPGRLIDHLERRRVSLSRVEMLILDEADRMLDMGFIEPVELIAAATAPSRQTLLFSATLQGNVYSLSKRLMKDSIEIAITPERVNHENIDQRLCYVDDIHHKYRLLDHFLEDLEITQAIVFTATKRLADELVDELLEKGCSTAALHGDMNQRQRTKTISRMRKGEIKILVATDVAARGIDLQSISHVINFDLPNSKEDYVHRIGRTGRAGATGIALSFAAHRERGLITQIERFTGQEITPHVIPGLEPTARRSSSQPRSPQKPFHRRSSNKSFSRGR
jgi:superfamily II DNA/RNA helicase